MEKQEISQHKRGVKKKGEGAKENKVKAKTKRKTNPQRTPQWQVSWMLHPSL